MSFEFHAGGNIHNTAGGDMVGGDKVTTTTTTTTTETGLSAEDMEQMRPYIKELLKESDKDEERDELKMESIMMEMGKMGLEKLVKVLVKVFI